MIIFIHIKVEFRLKKKVVAKLKNVLTTINDDQIENNYYLFASFT